MFTCHLNRYALSYNTVQINQLSFSYIHGLENTENRMSFSDLFPDLRHVSGISELLGHFLLRGSRCNINNSGIYMMHHSGNRASDYIYGWGLVVLICRSFVQMPLHLNLKIDIYTPRLHGILKLGRYLAYLFVRWHEKKFIVFRILISEIHRRFITIGQHTMEPVITCKCV